MAAVTTLPAAFVSGDVLTAAQQNGLRGAFRVLQVVQSSTTTAVSITSGSYVTTGLTGTITPSSTSSKILIFSFTPLYTAAASKSVSATIFRGTVAGTDLAPSADGLGRTNSDAAGLLVVNVCQALDSPSTISAQTYTVGVKVGSGGTVSAQFQSQEARMLLMEISA